MSPTRHAESPAHPQAPRITLKEFLALIEAHHPFARMLGIEILEIGFGTARLALPPNP